MLELVDKIDHVLAHWRAMDAVNEAAILESGVLCFHFLHHLFSEGTHFGRTCDGHVLIALVSNIIYNFLTTILVIYNDVLTYCEVTA